MSSTDFDVWITQYLAVLSRVAAGYAGSSAEREDLLQEICIALWRALPRFRGESRELTFVLSVAHNRGISFASKQKRNVPVPVPASLADPNANVARDVERREESRKLTAAIRQLPPSQRQAVMLQLEGLSGKEIAVVQGTTENNVNVRLNRARNALRALLKTAE